MGCPEGVGAGDCAAVCEKPGLSWEYDSAEVWVVRRRIDGE